MGCLGKPGVPPRLGSSITPHELQCTRPQGQAHCERINLSQDCIQSVRATRQQGQQWNASTTSPERLAFLLGTTRPRARRPVSNQGSSPASCTGCATHSSCGASLTVSLTSPSAHATLMHRQRRVNPLLASCVQSCSSVRITGLCILPNVSGSSPSFITTWAQTSTAPGDLHQVCLGCARAAQIDQRLSQAFRCIQGWADPGAALHTGWPTRGRDN